VVSTGRPAHAPTCAWIERFVAKKAGLVGVLVSLSFPVATGARAEQRTDARAPSTQLDHVVARWWSAELGDVRRPQLVFARQLAFQARLEAMAQGEPPDAAIGDRHLRAALHRHVTESMLERLPLEPPAQPVEVARRAEQARHALLARVGSEQRLDAARDLEGLSRDELDALLRRTARASLYLERMVAPQLVPTDLELSELHASDATPFSDMPLSSAMEPMRRWVLGQRLAEALDAFFQRARTRITIRWTTKPIGKAG
jgi:hypothetical protein